MALSKEQTELIIALVKKGDLSNVAISKQVGCSESAVRTTIKKNGTVKNEIKDLANEEVQSIIIQNEIKTRKNELTSKERDIYNDVFVDLKTSLGVFNNSTLDNQYLINKAQHQIKNQIESDEDMAIEHLPNLMAISKVTETNRKQILGVTEAYKPEEEEENTKYNNLNDFYGDVS